MVLEETNLSIFKIGNEKKDHQRQYAIHQMVIEETNLSLFKIGNELFSLEASELV